MKVPGRVNRYTILGGNKKDGADGPVRKNLLYFPDCGAIVLHENQNVSVLFFNCTQ